MIQSIQNKGWEQTDASIRGADHRSHQRCSAIGSNLVKPFCAHVAFRHFRITQLFLVHKVSWQRHCKPLNDLQGIIIRS